MEFDIQRADEVLAEKFNELSEEFSAIKDSDKIEPEQKCVLIDMMLKIYNVLFRS